jgi:capsid portal protein
MKIWDLLKFESRPMLTRIGFMVHDDDIPVSRRRDLAVDGLSIIEYYLKSLGPDVTRFCEEEKLHELYVFQMIVKEENLKVNSCKDFLESIRILQDRLKNGSPETDDPEELLKWIGHFLVVAGFVVERRMLEESLLKVMSERSKERVL